MQVDNINEAKHPSANASNMDDEKPHPPSEHAPAPTPAPNQRDLKREQRLHRFEEKVTKFTDPINKVSVSAGCESFLPVPLEEECRKAARIITSLSAYVPPRTVALESYEMYPPAQPAVTISPSALANAVGVLTLTTLRLGFGRITFSTSSGLLIARRESGAWGLPTAVRGHSFGGGPVALGVGITDRVYLINDRKTLNDFGKKCYVVDAEGVLALGGFGGGGGLTFVVPCKGKHHNYKQKKQWGWWRGGEHQGEDAEGAMTRSTTGHSSLDEKTPINRHPKKGDKMKNVKDSLGRPVHCYMRCRGLYAGLQAQGAAVLPREDANEAFYGCRLTAEQLISGVAQPQGDGAWQEATKVLVDSLERAGRIPPPEKPVEEPAEEPVSKEDEIVLHP